jgi:hypothetical protein
VNENSKHFSSSTDGFKALCHFPHFYGFCATEKLNFSSEAQRGAALKITVRSLGCKLDARSLLVSTDSEKIGDERNERGRRMKWISVTLPDTQNRHVQVDQYIHRAREYMRGNHLSRRVDGTKKM